MPAHVHAQSMALYAQDALETDKPWQRWEFLNEPGNDWAHAYKHPEWLTQHKYRRKPRKILVNGVEVPAPEEAAPAYGTSYWIPGVDTEQTVHDLMWGDDASDRCYLERGLVHLTKAAAQAHAEAMLKFTKV